MPFTAAFKANLFNTNTQNFEQKAIELFRFQAANNAVYKLYLDNLRVNPSKVDTISAIPFLPIDFFKRHRVVSADYAQYKVFESSGTTQQTTSRHYVGDVPFYLKNCEEIFKMFYGPLQDYIFFALLPSYLERENSSLVSMVQYFVEQSNSPYSGFYLYNTAEMLTNINKARSQNKKIVLIGVTFALLDLADQYNVDLSDIIIMETGGMKGRRKELLREEVHETLQQSFNCGQVHSEYGMTELLSQAYSLGESKFTTPPWMKIILRDPNDPFDYSGSRSSGGVNIIDLANVDSCAFIETSDIGSYQEDGSFKVLGRMDNSDIRGCNLLLA